MTVSSTPPDSVKVVVPKSIIWAIIGSLIVNVFVVLGAVFTTWLNMHDAILQLQDQLGAFKERNDTKHDEFQRRIDRIDQEIGRAPDP